VVHTVLHAGGKFGGGGYKVSGGLHGVGVSVVNALSSWMRVESARDGSVWSQEYERGKPKTPVKKIGPSGGRRGTTTQFRADPEMFETIDYSFDLISQRLRESAYLTKGVWITLRHERLDREDPHHALDGHQNQIHPAEPAGKEPEGHAEDRVRDRERHDQELRVHGFEPEQPEADDRNEERLDRRHRRERDPVAEEQLQLRERSRQQAL